MAEEKKAKITNKILILMLVLIMLQWASGYYFYDFPQLFTGVLIDKFNLTTVDISTLYTITSIPNLISNIFASMLIQKIGISISSLCFLSLLFFGIFSCYLGIEYNNFNLIILGRFIFGIGFDTTWLAQLTITEKWFSGRFLTLAYGLNRAACFLFQSIATYAEPELFVKTRSLEIPMLVYACVTSFTFITTIFMIGVDLKYEKYLVEEGTQQILDKRRFKLKDIKRLSSMFWMLFMYFAFFSMCYFQFMNFGSDFLVKGKGLEYLHAKNSMAIIPTVAGISTPLLSLISQKIGQKSHFLMLSTISAFAGYSILLYMPFNGSAMYVYSGFACIGLFWGFFLSNIWSSITLIIPKQSVNFVFALAATMQNLFLTVFPQLFGYLNKDRNQKAYKNSLYVLLLISGCAFLLSLVITVTDYRTGKMLNLPENHADVKKNSEKLIENFSRSIVNPKNFDGHYKSLGPQQSKLTESADNSPFVVHSGNNFITKEEEEDDDDDALN